MAKTQTELDKARSRIRSVGVNEMARRSKVARRTLQYMLAGTFNTKYENIRKVLDAR